MKILILLLSLLAGVFSVSATELVIPQVKKVPSPGTWGVSEYNRALVISGAVSIGKNGGIPRLENCQFRLLHDGTDLACFVQVQIPQKTKLIATKKQRDSEVDKDDSVELFFSPGKEMDPVRQIVVNSIGTVLDLRVLEQRTEDLQWTCEGLKIAVSVQRGLWDVQFRIPLASVGIRKDQVFRFNAVVNDRFRSHKSFWSAAQVKKGFRDYERQFRMRLGDLNTKGVFYSANEYAEQMFDGHFEYDMRGFEREGSVYRSRYRQYDGKNSLMFTAKKESPVARIRKTIAIRPGESVRVFGAVHLYRVEQPDFSPARVEFLDAEGKILKSVNAPGLGNMGGSVTADAVRHLCEFTAVAPEGTANAAMVWSLDGTTGVMRIDAVSFRKNYMEWSAPRLFAPAAGSVSRKNELDFVWRSAGNASKNTSYTLELSRTADFKKDVLRYEGVYSGCKLQLNGNGKWFWRIGSQHEKSSEWSAVSEFTLDITPRNEKNKPVVKSMIPFGLQKTKPSELVISYQDPGISSGIDLTKVRLQVGGKDVTSSCRVSMDQLCWKIPAELKKGVPLHYSIVVQDRNRNSIRRNGWFMYGEGGISRLDSGKFITHKGKRVFPIAMYGMSKLGIYPQMSAGHIDTNFCPWADDENLLAHLGEAAANGMYVVAFVPGNTRILAGDIPLDSAAGKHLDSIALSRAEKIKDHPNLLGFFIGDETMDSQGTKPELVRAWYKRLKKIAPNQLIYWLPTYQLRDVERVASAKGACDLITWHDYSYTRRNVLRVVETADAVKNAIGNMPHFLLPEAYGDLPPRDFIRFQSFLGIISGSRGLSFYTDYKHRDLTQKDPYAKTHFPNYLQEVYAVAKELQALKEVLCADDSRDFYSIINEKGALRSVGKKHNGKYYIFAVNAGKEVFRGKIAGNWKRAVVNGKEVPMKNGEFSLELKSTGSALILAEK